MGDFDPERSVGQLNITTAALAKAVVRMLECRDLEIRVL